MSLWTWEQLTGGCGVKPSAGDTTNNLEELAVTGISIDTRTINPGDLFIALT